MYDEIVMQFLHHTSYLWVCDSINSGLNPNNSISASSTTPTHTPTLTPYPYSNTIEPTKEKTHVDCLGHYIKLESGNLYDLQAKSYNGYKVYEC